MAERKSVTKTSESKSKRSELTPTTQSSAIRPEKPTPGPRFSKSERHQPAEIVRRRRRGFKLVNGGWVRDPGGEQA